MNRTSFWRLLWKEYRLQRSLWLAIAVLGTLVETWILMLQRFGNGEDQAGFVMVLYGASLVHAWIYAMGCGAVLFAAERENETYDFQRALPVSAFQVLVAKLTFALASTAVLLGSLLLLAAALAGWTLPEPDACRAQWGIIGFATLEVLVWTIFFSLLLQGPLQAAILGVTAASFVTCFLLSRKLGGAAALPPRALVAAVLALADCGLGWRWFRDSTGSGLPWGNSHDRLAVRPPARDDSEALSRGSMLGRLAWQHWRESGWLLILLGVLTALAALPAVAMPPYWMLEDKGLFDAYLHSTSAAWLQFSAYWSFWLLGAIASALLGVFAFRADQRGASYRFLADRGVSSRVVWLSRQLAWLCLVALGTTTLLLVAIVGDGPPRVLANVPPWWIATDFTLAFSHASRVLLLVVFGCAIGQLCSMFLRSAILAAVLAVVLSLLAVAWASLMEHFQASWLWSVAPIPLAMLLATWLRAGDWMGERRRVRTWLLPGLVLAVPGAGLLTAVALFRAHEVPDVDPGFSVEKYSEPAAPEAVKTAEMYLRALDLYVRWNVVQGEAATVDLTDLSREHRDQRRRRLEAAMLKANQKSLEMTLEATRRPVCDFLAQSESLPSRAASNASGPRGLSDLGTLVAMNARRLESEGKLNEALDQWFAELRLSAHLGQRANLSLTVEWLESQALRGLTDWAARPGQSSQKVLDALRRLPRFHAGIPAPSEPIQWEYWHAQRVLQEQPSQSQEPLVVACLRSLPWERERTRRAWKQGTSSGLAAVNEVAAQIAAGTNPRLPRFPTDYKDRRLGRSPWSHNTFLGDYCLYGAMGGYRILVRQYARLETEWRVTGILMALQAWRLDHGGQLPTSLDALKGRYLDDIPLDPCCGEPFRYYAQGWPLTLTPRPNDYGSPTGSPIAPGTPFLWSIGCEIDVEGVLGANVDKLDRYQIHGYRGTRAPSCEEDLLVRGWPFPIPTASR